MLCFTIFLCSQGKDEANQRPGDGGSTNQQPSSKNKDSPPVPDQTATVTEPVVTTEGCTYQPDQHTASGEIIRPDRFLYPATLLLTLLSQIKIYLTIIRIIILGDHCLVIETAIRNLTEMFTNYSFTRDHSPQCPVTHPCPACPSPVCSPCPRCPTHQCPEMKECPNLTCSHDTLQVSLQDAVDKLGHHLTVIEQGLADVGVRVTDLQNGVPEAVKTRSAVLKDLHSVHYAIGRMRQHFSEVSDIR